MMDKYEMTHDDLFDELDRLEAENSDMGVEIRDLEVDLKVANGKILELEDKLIKLKK